MDSDVEIEERDCAVVGEEGNWIYQVFETDIGLGGEEWFDRLDIVFEGRLSEMRPCEIQKWPEKRAHDEITKSCLILVDRLSENDSTVSDFQLLQFKHSMDLNHLF